MSPFLHARPAFESVGVWKYSLSEASCSIRRLSSDMRPSAVLIGMQSWQRVSPQGWREYNQYWIAPASNPSAMSHRSASLSLSATLLARSTVLEKAASKVSAIGSMAGSIGIESADRNANFPRREAMFNGSFEPQRVDAQMPGTAALAAKQSDVRYLCHVHEPAARSVADVLEGDPDRAPLQAREIEAPIEAV